MKFSILNFLLLIFCSTAFGQEQGQPLVRFYSPKDYKSKPQILSVWQDLRGIMYFGVGDGFMEYDGVNWREYSTNKKGIVYDYLQMSENEIFVSAGGEFGHLIFNSLATIQFESLSKALPDSSVKVGAVWGLSRAGNSIFFRSNEHIFSYNLNSKKVHTFKAAQNELFKGDFVFQNQYYAHSLSKGFMEINGETTRLAPQGEFFAEKNVAGKSLNFTENSLIVPTRDKGLFLYHFSKDSLPKNFLLNDNDFFEDNDIYSSKKLSNNRFALISLKKGALIFDQNARTIQTYNEKNAVGNNQIFSITEDKNQNYWLGMSIGIAKTEHSEDLSYWDKNAGLNNIVESVIRFNKKIYAATHEKVYFIDKKNQAREVKNVPVGQNWEFLDFKTDNESLLLLAGKGICQIADEEAKIIHAGSGRSFTMYQSVFNPKRLFAIDEPFFISLIYDKGKWILEGKWEGIKDNIRGIIEDKNGEIWLGTFRNGVIRVTPDKKNLLKPKLRYYNDKNGFKSLKNILPFKFQDKILFGTENGLMIYKPETDRFEPFCEFGEQFCNGSRDVFSLFEAKDGKIWICPLENEKADVGYLEKNSKGGYDWHYKAFRRIPKMFMVSFYAEPEGVLWFGGNLGLFRYDASKDVKNYEQKFNCLIREVKIGGDSLVFGGGKRDFLQEKEDFPYELNSVKFEFAAPFFDQEDQTLYAFKLEGFDEKWSAWGRMTEKEYTNLNENSYTFLVKAKNIYGVESDVTSYPIAFSPPFYRRWWAFLMYILGTLSGVYALVKWNTKRLILEKTALENTIRERTAEILQQNENVKKLSEIGRELTASLNLQHILSTLYAHVNAIMDASVFGIGLYKADKQIIDYQMAIENGVFYKPYTRDMTDKNQLPVWCIENKVEVFINDVEIDECKYLSKSEVKTTKFALEDGSLSELPQSIIYVPLLLKDQVLGIITVQSFRKNSYTEQHLIYLKNIASYASIALDNSISYLQIAAQQKEIAEANDNINQANEELQQQQEELLMMNENLENQKATLAQTYSQLKITSEQLEKSIEYASHIQEVIMPEKEQLLSFFSDIFILYKPKDVVSGDFYWFAQTTAKKAIFALADCTGHGVPGAFMTMLGATLMHEIVNVRQLSGNPSDILQHLHCSVQKILKQIEGQNNDGMDISVCFFEKEPQNNTRLIFSGAKSRMYYTLEREIFEINGDKQFLGGKEELKFSFTNQEFLLPQSAQFYLFSDGYADQNDEKRKKIGSVYFKKIIAQNSHLPFEEQKSELLQVLSLHQNTEAQRDDITVVALKL